VFGDIARALIPVAAGALRREGEALIRLLDSTPIPLNGKRFAWAEAPMPAPGVSSCICCMIHGTAGRCGSR
jgi:hypothetical protein